MTKLELTPQQASDLYLNINKYYLFVRSAENLDKCFFYNLKFWNPVMNNHLKRARQSVGALMTEFNKHFSPKDSDVVQYDLPSEMYRVVDFFSTLMPDQINEIMTQLEQQIDDING